MEIKQFPEKTSLIKLKLSVYSFLLLTILIGKLNEHFLIDGKTKAPPKACVKPKIMQSEVTVFNCTHFSVKDLKDTISIFSKTDLQCSY